MTTHHEIPKVQADVVVSIGVPPVADSNPVAPPPASGGATLSHHRSEDCPWFFFTLRLISTIILLCLFIKYDILNPNPRFKVESMSVALDKTDISNNQSQAIRATWNVGFSIKNRPGREIIVSVRCMSSNWSANIIEGARNTNLVDAVVITLLPREFVLPELMVRGLTLQYDVLFRTNRRGDMLEGVCKNMTVAFSPNATQGIMVGGQRSCHVHHL